MNWQRGLFRVWLVITVLWAMFVFAGILVLSPSLAPGGAFSLLILASIPPAILFVIGALSLWAARGFSTERTERNMRTFWKWIAGGIALSSLVLIQQASRLGDQVNSSEGWAQMAGAGGIIMLLAFIVALVNSNTRR